MPSDRITATHPHVACGLGALVQHANFISRLTAGLDGILDVHDFEEQGCDSFDQDRLLFLVGQALLGSSFTAELLLPCLDRKRGQRHAAAFEAGSSSRLHDTVCVAGS